MSLRTARTVTQQNSLDKQKASKQKLRESYNYKILSYNIISRRKNAVLHLPQVFVAFSWEGVRIEQWAKKVALINTKYSSLCLLVSWTKSPLSLDSQITIFPFYSWALQQRKCFSKAETLEQSVSGAQSGNNTANNYRLFIFHSGQCWWAYLGCFGEECRWQ